MNKEPIPKNMHVTEWKSKWVHDIKRVFSRRIKAMTNEEIREIAEIAVNSLGGPKWEELDVQTQTRLFDVAVDICERGGPTSGYEQAVADAKAAYTPKEVKAAAAPKSEKEGKETASAKDEKGEKNGKDAKKK